MFPRIDTAFQQPPRNPWRPAVTLFSPCVPMQPDAVAEGENSLLPASGREFPSVAHSPAPGGSVVLGTPGASEPLAVAQAPGAGPLQAAVAVAGQVGAGPASLVVSRANVTPAGGGTVSPAVSDSVLAAAAMPTATVAPAAVDSLLAAQPVPASGAVTPAIVGRVSLRWLSLVSPASPIPHADAAVIDRAGVQPAGDARPRVAALRTAASGEASDEVLLRCVDARPGDTKARARNQQPATGLFSPDLQTLDLLAVAATKPQ
jgi:hypothetical protein